MQAATETPRFRTDLVAQPIDDGGERFVEVTDPDSGGSYRFYEVEYSIACAMDGSRDVGGLARWAFEELGLETSPDELSTVIATLSDLGYLEGTTAAVAASPPAIASAPAPVAPVAAAAGAMDVELGVAGGTPEIAVGSAPIESGDVELGLPGRSPLTPARAAPPAAEPLELGAAGTSSAEIGEPQFETLSPPLPAPSGEPEESFADVMPDTAASVVPPPTSIPAPPSDFGDLDGITPPPAEVPVASLRPSTSPSSDDDGPTNLPPPAPGMDIMAEEEVSVDLSDHLSIDTSDVKEAVRQSQVMQAVSVPQELLDEISGKAPEVPAVPPAPEVDAPADLPDVPSLQKVKSRRKPAPPPEASPMELPETPSNVSGPIAEPAPEPRRGVSPVLIVFLLLALVGGGAYYYFFVYKKSKEGTTAGKTPTTQGTNGTKGTTAGNGTKGPNNPHGTKQTPPPAPKPITFALNAEQPSTTTELTNTITGRVPWVAADGLMVQKGDEVAHLKEYDRYKRKYISDGIERGKYYQAKLDKSQKLLDAAKADGNASAIARAERQVAAHQRKVDEKARYAEEYGQKMKENTLFAPVEGKVEQVKGPGWIKEGEVVVRIHGAPLIAGSFEQPKAADKAYKAGDSIEVKAGDATTTCDVTEVTGTKVSVACTPVTGIAMGANVTVVTN